MTDSANKNPQNSFNDFTDELDDMLDEVKSSLVSLNDQEDDEGDIDRLLLADAFDAEESHQAESSKDQEIGDIDLSDEFEDEFKAFMSAEEPEEENDHFVDDFSDYETHSSDDEIPNGIEGFFDFDEQDLDASDLTTDKAVDQNGKAEALFEEHQNDNLFFADFNVSPDKDIFDDMELFDLKNQPDIDAAPSAAQDHAISEEKPETVLPWMSMPDLNEAMAGIKSRRSEKGRFEFDNADMTASGLFNSDQESISLIHKTLRTEFENKIKNIRLYAYIATGLGGAALIAAIGFGLMTHGAKQEVSRLSEFVNTLDVGAGQGAVLSSGKELRDIQAAIEELNQRVDGVVEQLANKDPLSAQAEVNKSVEESAEQEVEKELNRLKDLQARLDVLESKALAEDAARSATAKPIDTYIKVKEANPQKMVFGKTNSTADWFVNLIAYRQQWYAKSKAAEFEQKGIPVDVVDVKVNNVTWYRLRVGGFKNKSEAVSYAAKVKKILKLNSVWVGNIQG